MLRKIRKKNNITAFTLTELLVTIVIITVLSAVVFGIAPNFIRTLKQARLDKNAETVYYAVQNRMTELRTSGRSEEYQPENSNGQIVKFDSTYSFDMDGVAEPPIGQMAYFDANRNSHSALASTLLPRDRIDETLWNGKWIVEFNYETGTVWGVFYIDNTSDVGYDPDTVKRLKLRDDSERLNNFDSYKVGYYGKGTAEFHPGEDKYDKPTVKITNEEKLIATLSCDRPSGCKDTYVNFYYIIHQIDDDNKILGKTEKTYKTENVLATGDKFTVDVVLDSLDSTFYSNFVGVTDANSLEPGANMLIEVWVAGKDSEESEHTKDPDSCKFNSLFSDKTVYKDNCAILSYGRHLQNLNSATSHVSSNITKAKIDSNISFSSGSPWAVAYNTKKVVPIRNNSLESFDGNSKSITGLDVIAQTDKNAGLFDTFYGNEIKDLTLISPVAKDVSEAAGAGSSGHVGLLAGELAVSKNTTISNITITKPGTSGATENVPTAISHLGNAGGLIGMVSCSSSTACQLTVDNIKIDNVDVESEVISGATQSGNAGGLIGEIGSSDKLTVALSNILLNDPSRRADSSQRFYIKSTRNNAGGFVGSSSAILQIPAATVTTDNNGDSNATAQNQVSAYDIEVSTNFGADETKGNAGGVVGYLNAKTTISNLYLAHVTIAVGDGDAVCKGSGGGVFGLVTTQVNNSSNISGITFAATDRSEDLGTYPVNITGGDFYAGGFAGYIKGSLIISGIKFDQGVSVSISGAAVGGFVGSVQADASFSSCTVNNAIVKGESSTSDSNRKGYAGGFAGEITGKASINNCSVANTYVFSQSAGAGGFLGVGSSDFSASSNSCIDTEVFSQGAGSDQDTGCYAGGFAGHISGGNPTISSFQFRYSSAGSNKLPELGIDSSNKTITITDTKQSTAGSAIAGRTATGGIIGAITGGQPTINTSFSATVLGYYSYHEGSTDSVVFESGSTGGLVGYYSDSGNYEIEKSYADSYVFGKTVGGLIGGSGVKSNIPTIKNCYAAGYLIGSTVQAGLSAGTELNAEGGNYTVCCPKGQGKTIISTVEKNSGTSQPYYLYSGTINVGLQINYTLLNCNTFVSKLGSDFSIPDKTVKYNLNASWITTDDVYPYPRINAISIPTYGDWDFGYKAQFVYFENYSNSVDGPYYIYYKDDSGNPVSTLQEKTVTGDGYGILYDQNVDKKANFTFKLNGSAASLNETSVYVVVDEAGTTRSMKLMVLDFKYSEDVNTIGTQTPLLYNADLNFSGCYGRSETEDVSFSLNPRTAKCIIPQDTKSGTLYIRSPRQLYALSRTYYKTHTTGWNYQQELNLDYSTYLWTSYSKHGRKSGNYFVQNPIGGDNITNGATVAFSETYDGNYCEINNLSLTLTGDGVQAGLFAKINGAVTNVFLVNKYDNSPSINLVITRGSSNGTRIGILAGEVIENGSVYNCAVCGYSISISFNIRATQTERYIGGLIGYNNGKITNCSVAIREIEVVHSTSILDWWIHKLIIGGFTGGNGGTGNIENCYVIAGNIYHEVSKSFYKNDSAVAGFAGQNQNTIKSCYSMTGSSKTGSTGIWYGFSRYNSGISDSYWLSLSSQLWTYGFQKYYRQEDSGAGGTAASYSEMGKMINYASAYYQRDSKLTTYPFRAVVTNGKTNSLIHYGDWPVSSTSFTLADFTLTPNTSQLTLSENDSTILYITEADSETGNKIDEQIPLLASACGGNVTVSEAAGDEYDDKLGKTVEEVVDSVTGDLPGAIPFLVTAVSPGEDSIQVDQKEVLDDAFVAIYGMDDEGDTDTVNLEEETTEGDNNSSDFTTPEQSALPEEIQLSENYDNDDEVEEPEYELQEENSPESDEEKIYILTTPLTLSVNVYRNAHAGIIPCHSEEETDSYPDFCSNAKDVTLPAQELGGEYPDEDSVVGAYNVNYPLTYGLEEGYSENTNLFLYLARDASIETSQSALAIQNVTVIRHVTSLTEILDQTYELYNREDNEANLWNYEDYFFKTGEPFIEQNEDYCYTYLPVTFTGKYDDPVTICVTVTYGNDTYHLSYDMDVVQNKFKVTYQDGFFTIQDGFFIIREDVLDYGSVFTIPTKSEIDELYNSWEDSKKQKYDSIKEGYVYPEIVDEDQGESIWTSNQVLPLYEDVTYQLRREPISYTISFSPNGGEGEMESVSAIYDKLVELPPCTYTKAGYSFAGWALEVTAEEIDWFPDESLVYPLCNVDGGEVILYAMWNHLPSDEELEESEEKEVEISENTKDEEKELTEESSEKKSEDDSNVSSPQNGQSSAESDTNNDTSGEKGADSSAVSQSGEEDIASDSSDESKQEEKTEKQDTKDPTNSSATSTVNTSEDNSPSGTESQKDENSSGESFPNSGKTEISLDSPDKMENTKPVTEPIAENEDKKHQSEKTEE